MSTARIPHPPSSIDLLRNQIRKLETAARSDDGRVISTGCGGLDRQLPRGGFSTGTITEWLTSSAGAGAELLSLLAARQACADGGALVVIDPRQRFYPAAAAAWGINLENVIVLRTPAASRSAADPFSSALLWAIDQSLRCPAVAAVWGRLGEVHERWLRRFQLSAEQSGAMGLFVRPQCIKGQPGWSEVQWQVGGMEKKEIGSRSVECGTRNGRPGSQISNSKSQMPGSQAAAGQPPLSEPMQRAMQQALQKPRPTFDRLIPLRLLRVRGGQADAEKTIHLQIDFTTGKVQTVTETHEQSGETQNGPGQPGRRQDLQKHSVHLASQLAHPKTGGRQQRA